MCGKVAYECASAEEAVELGEVLIDADPESERAALV